MVAWLAIGVTGVSFPTRLQFISRVLFPIGALGGIALAVAGFVALSQAPSSLVLPIGLPNLPAHLRLDSLSGFFLVLLGAVSAGISVFSAGYFRAGEGTAPGLLCVQYHLFLASMACVLLADDAYSFMVAWETMAMSSYFLVTSNHKIPEIRRAGFLYLLIAHIGAVGILLAFAVLQTGQSDYTFAAMRANSLHGHWAAAAFLLALFGFGAKAGLLPLHAWLPEAHPAAPSPVSALMSGVMLKTAIYGLIRVTFDLLGTQVWWWGVLALAIGLATAVFGVLFSAVQTDMKRLLAYSSVENIGIIVTGIGLAIVFKAFGIPVLAAVALTAALYHCLNHAFFKSLLFLATGSVLHATRERSLGKLGGLIHRMPWVALLALVGALAAAGLPPLNAFASEWLLLQAFLQTPGLKNTYLNMLIPLASAAFVLAAALASYIMVKFFGVIFLGQPREEKLAEAHDPPLPERFAMLYLALACVALGVLPVLVVQQLDFVTSPIIGATVGGGLNQSGWLFLTPVSPERASYSPFLFLLCIVATVLITFLLVRKLYHGRVRRADAWDCGYPQQNSRMQDTAEGFGQPIKQIFAPFFDIERRVPTPFDDQPHYNARAGDRLWTLLYLPIARATAWLADRIGVLQQGRIQVYLVYSFATLIVLLVLVVA